LLAFDPQPGTLPVNRIFDSGWTRALSLAMALALMPLITLLPRGLTTEDGSAISHGLLSLIMWGMSAGFVHGIGFIPQNRVLRVLLGPVVAWLGMGVALVFYVQYFLR
jgi:cyd operon protein YbgE